MSFMDKAKKVAEQAQQKLEEAQKQFNERQTAGQSPAPGGAERFDEHGRPISGEPAPPSAPEGQAPADEPAPPAAPPGDAPNANPDPFKPLGS